MSWINLYKSAERSMSFHRLYGYWFKALLNKACSCIVIDGGDDVRTVNKDYLKRQLILTGGAALTDKMPKGNGKLYAVFGTIGGMIDEYYMPVEYIVSNPVLGSANLRWREFDGKEQDCVLITNTATDKIMLSTTDSGLYNLISQTSVLLADNIISINCAQKNCRPVAFVSAQGEETASGAEAVMEDIYEGKTYKIMTEELEAAIKVSPLANTGVSQSIAQLMELQTYIVSNFLQQIGIKANNLRKKERLITDEIDAQDNLTALSITEMIESWQRGFDEANKMYGTDYKVSLNPAIAQELINAVMPDNGTSSADAQPAEDTQPATGSDESAAPDDLRDDSGDTTAEDTQTIESDETVTEQIEEATKAIEDIAEHLAGGEEVDANETDAEDQ